MSLHVGIACVFETVVRVGIAVLDALFPGVPDDVMDLAEAFGVTAPPAPPVAPGIPRPRVDAFTVIDRHLHPVDDLDTLHPDAPIPFVLTGSQPSSEFDVDIRSLGEAWSDESLEQAMDILNWGGDTP